MIWGVKGDDERRIVATVDWQKDTRARDQTLVFTSHVRLGPTALRVLKTCLILQDFTHYVFGLVSISVYLVGLEKFLKKIVLMTCLV